jgi:predicted phosphate transport protein (TIGR00153 family)
MWIDRLIRLVLPRQDLFFTLLEGLAAKMTEAAAVFAELGTATSHEQFASVSSRLKPIETQADHLCHQLYEELDRSFVTPIDREDLALLTSALDDVIDSMEHSAAFAALYRFSTLTDPMRQMIRITGQAVAALAQAVANLRKFHDPESIRGVTVTVHTLENEADTVYRAAIAGLFLDEIDSRELIRQKDMLFCLEDGVDQCEDAMDVIRSVVVKNG